MFEYVPESFLFLLGYELAYYDHLHFLDLTWNPKKRTGIQIISFDIDFRG